MEISNFLNFSAAHLYTIEIHVYMFVCLCVCLFVCVFASLSNGDCVVCLSCNLHSTSHIVTPRELFFVLQKSWNFAEKSPKIIKIGLIWWKSSQNQGIFYKWCSKCVHNDIQMFLGPNFSVEFVFRGYFEKTCRKSAFFWKNMLFFEFFRAHKQMKLCKSIVFSAFSMCVVQSVWSITRVSII